MCLNIVERNSLRYATKDKVCYKVLKVLKYKDKKFFYASYYSDFEYFLNKKYNTEIKLRGRTFNCIEDPFNIFNNLNYEIAKAINSYYTRLVHLEYITCGFHTIESFKDAFQLKSDFPADYFSREYRIFECVIPKDSWYYIGVDDLHHTSFVSNSLIIKKQCVW